jgi:uncharacterized protein YdbL (DUF1318 family)
MKKTFSAFAVAVFAAAGAVSVAVPVLAQTGTAAPNPAREAVNRAQEAGTVGEGADGYLAFVGSRDAAPVDLQRAVAAINAGRRGLYTEYSTTRVPPQTVEQWAVTFAVQQIQRLPMGRMLRDGSGEWCAKTSATVASIASDGTVTIRCR